jgi:hypothetical protein
VRVTTAPRRGAVLVLSLLLTPMVTIIALVGVEYVALWTVRHQLVIATDAAALAAASARARAGDDAAHLACVDFLEANLPAEVADTGVCELLPSDETVAADLRGMVRVSVRSEPPLMLALGLFGSGPTVEVTSAARAGRPLAVSGVRPFALCRDALLPTDTSRTLLDVWEADGYREDVVYGPIKVNVQCGQPDDTVLAAPANLQPALWQDRSGSNQQIASLFASGSDLPVRLCQPVVQEQPWQNNADDQFREGLQVDATPPAQPYTVPIALYALMSPAEEAECFATTGLAPASSGLRVVGFVGMTVVEAAGNGRPNFYVRVKLHRLTVSGVCCDFTSRPDPTGVIVSVLCDPDRGCTSR